MNMREQIEAMLNGQPSEASALVEGVEVQDLRKLAAMALRALPEPGGEPDERTPLTDDFIYQFALNNQRYPSYEEMAAFARQLERAITSERERNEAMAGLLRRYRNETPFGHQPYGHTWEELKRALQNSATQAGTLWANTERATASRDSERDTEPALAEPAAQTEGEPETFVAIHKGIGRIVVFKDDYDSLRAANAELRERSIAPCCQKFDTCEAQCVPLVRHLRERCERAKWPDDFETGMQHAYEIAACQPDLHTALRAIADDIEACACHPHEHECPTCGQMREPLSSANERAAQSAAELERVRKALQRIMSIDGSCDFVDGAPEICPGIASNGGPCHWCEARQALASREGA
jgi:hypothetical protein